MAQLTNRLRERREANGLSQAVLAQRAAVTRQSVNSIECGRSVPGVDVALRIAEALSCRVEDLFGREPSGELSAEPCGEATTGRVALAELEGRWVSFALSGSGGAQAADALVTSVERRSVRVELLRPAPEARDNLVVMGCAAALGLIAQRLNVGSSNGRCVWIPGSSTAALQAFDRAQVHLAGVHLTDGSGQFNVADVRRRVRGFDHELIALARWQIGLVVPAGNPRGIRKLEDLGQRGLRWVVREPGSGARRLWDRLLTEQGLTESRDAPSRRGPRAASQALEARGHFELAHAVSLSAADVGIATLDAALAFNLRFIPVAQERYDLVVKSAHLEDPRVKRWFDLMTSAASRRELQAVGYDVSCAGERVAGQAA